MRRVFLFAMILCIAGLSAACSSGSSSTTPTINSAPLGSLGNGAGASRRPSNQTSLGGTLPGGECDDETCITNPNGCFDAFTCGADPYQGLAPGGSGGDGGGGTTGTTTQGPATKGDKCTEGITAPSVGSVIDGKPDQPGPGGNEVNNEFYISYSTGPGAGAAAGYLGDFITTLNNEVWFEPPISAPGTSTPIYVNMGNVSISPNAPMTAATWTNLIAQALGGPQNVSMPSAVKNAVTAFVKNSGTVAVGPNGTATIEPCFDGPWSGK